MSTLARRLHGRRTLGQSMTEGIVIVFLVGIGTIGVVGLFGDNIRNLFGSSSAAVAGNASVANTGSPPGNTKWTLRGGQLSAYNPGGTMDSPQQSQAPGGFNPGGSSSSPSLQLSQ